MRKDITRRLQARLKKLNAEQRVTREALAFAAKGVTVNERQRLYVIPHVDEGSGARGYTCLGFEVCEGRIERMEKWLASRGWVTPRDPRSGQKPAPIGTVERYALYEALMEDCAAECAEHKVKCPCELTPQLVGLEGKRVEVVTSWGETERFIVGRSTGWMPIHIARAGRNSTGGPAVVGAPFKDVKVLP